MCTRNRATFCRIYTDISLCACACVTAVVHAAVFMHAAFSVASFPIPSHVSTLVARELADSLCMSAAPTSRLASELS